MLTFGVRGLASPSLETPSATVMGVGGARDGEDFVDFAEVEGFGAVGLADGDTGVGGF